MHNDKDLYFPVSINLVDWVVLLTARGEIQCEVHLDDGSRAVFSIVKSDLSEPTPQALQNTIWAKFKQSTPAPALSHVTRVPTLIARTSVKLAG